MDISPLVSKYIGLRLSSWEEPPNYTDEELDYLQGFFREEKLPNGDIFRRNKKGELHNTRGPAIIWYNGTVEYWVNGKPHRTDGPAYIGADGTVVYFQNGLLHRTDGPAVIFSNGIAEYWVNGKRIARQQFYLRYGRHMQASLKFAWEDDPELRRYLELGKQDISYEEGGGHGGLVGYLCIDGRKYVLGTDDMADSAAYDQAMYALEEGLFDGDFMMSYMNGERVARDYDDYDYYYEIVSERPGDYGLEADENGNYNEDEIDEKAMAMNDERRREIIDNPYEFLKDLLGERDAKDKLLYYVDREELINAALRTDGRAHFINSYNGNEYTLYDLIPAPTYLPQELVEALGFDDASEINPHEIYAYRED